MVSAAEGGAALPGGAEVPPQSGDVGGGGAYYPEARARHARAAAGGRAVAGATLLRLVLASGISSCRSSADGLWQVRPSSDWSSPRVYPLVAPPRTGCGRCGPPPI
eukprot:1187266-Prorocentrum_minimum.AAC.1